MNRTYGNINTFETGNWNHSQMESFLQQTNILVRKGVVAKVLWIVSRSLIKNLKCLTTKFENAKA